jgi:hypothetical protein
MAKLILSLSGERIQEFELESEQMTIGRRTSNDIQIENLAVSGHHAKIITILNDSFIEDNNSTNGTYVNGVLIKKQALQNGDEITIGKHKLVYVNEQAAVAPEPPTGDYAQARSEVVAETTPSGDVMRGGATARLSVKTGVRAGQLLDITKPLTTLGRPGVQVAGITRKDDSYFIVHIESEEDVPPATVNNEALAAEPRQLANGDRLSVAGIDLEFQLA